MIAKLRVGVLLDSTHLRAWQRVLLDRIKNSHYAELALVIVCEGHEEAMSIEPRVRRLSVLQTFAAGLLNRFYLRLEQGIRCDHDAFAICDGTSVVAGIPRLAISADHDRTQDHARAYIDRIRGLNLDALLDLGSDVAVPGLGGAAKYGVWSLDGADYPRRHGAPPGFWEVCHGQVVTRMHLTQIDAHGEQHTLACSSAGTHPLSVKLNRSNAYWNALSLVPRKLAQLHSRGERCLLRQQRSSAVRPNRRAVLEPDLASMAFYIMRNLKRRAKERSRRTVNVEQWILLFHLGNSLCIRLPDFQSIVPPIDRYWADPHVIYRDGKHYVFVEEYLFAARKGHISVMSIDKDGRHGEPIKILERPYHLSYPFVFEHAGVLYMVPESMDNRTVGLYRCAEFPCKWEFVRNLLEGVAAVDSTLIHHSGKWWLFASILENEGGSASEELFVFYTDCFLTGTWTPHLSNPVVSDVRSARPAGPIQQRGGRLYRPSQDCSLRYGYATRINEIKTLSPEEYTETPVASIEPGWQKKILGTHTLAYAAGMTVVDALLLRPKFGQHH